MFDIGWSELLVLIIVALIFIGPKELPTALYFVGKVVGKIRDFIDSFYQQVADFKPNLSEEENEENYSSLSPSKRSSQKSDVRKKSPAKKNPSPKIKSTSGEKQKK